jgi:hypothetical protein
MDRPRSPASKVSVSRIHCSPELLVVLAALEKILTVLEKELNITCSGVRRPERSDCQRHGDNSSDHTYATTQVRKRLATRATLERILARSNESETSIAKNALVTDTDLARARQDPAFRYRLVAEKLELLLGELNRLRADGAEHLGRKTMYEGVDSAIKLLDLLQRIAPAKNARARA